jgi:hypothetical protein
MNKLVNFITGMALFLLLGIALVSCSGGGSGTVGSSGDSGIGGGNIGTLSLGLTDGPPPKDTYDAIYVTIKEIRVNHEHNGWETLSGPELNLPQTFNLLELVNGIIADLGAVELEAGHYNQMRLMLGEEPDDALNIRDEHHDHPNYLILEGDDVQIPLKVPSGYQTGIKLVKGFDIEHKGSTELLLDFDALKSIVKAGKSGKYLLKPTIKVIESRTFSVEGYVEDNEENPIQGANVSAQVYDPEVEDPKDEITEAARASSNENGYYFMYLPILQRVLNIVATMDGYLPECEVLDSGEGVEGIKNYIMDFALTQADETGTFKGSVSGLEDDNGSATFSIRQMDATCGMIEVASRSAVNTTEGAPDYFDPIILPVGQYEVVVSEQVEEGEEPKEVTQVWTIEVAADAETVLDVFFPTTSVEGIVDDGTDPLEGSMIGAYEAGDDLVTAVNKTASDVDGYYFMYLPTNLSSFNILATMDGFVPKCEVLTAPVPDTEPGTAGNILDFTLNPVGDTGTITGSVSGLTPAQEPAHFSILLDLSPCGMLEVASFDVDEGESSDPVVLPYGTYEVVVTAAEGVDTLEETVTLDAGNMAEEVVFPPPAP